MECPQCHGFSVIIKDGQKICEAKGCTYIEFHVITYENQNRQFEGEKGTENRFTIVYSAGNHEKESRLQKNYEACSKIIRKLAKQMGISTDLVGKAQTKLMQILKIKQKGKESMLNEKDSKEKDKQKNKDRITTSNRQIAGYCFWAACFDHDMPYKDVRIANQLQISKGRWEAMVKQLALQLKQSMQVPQLTYQHYVERICKKRKIKDIETNAMKKMIQNMRQYQIEGGTRRTTIAAVIFYLIMCNSKRYNSNNEFDMREYLTKKDKKNEQSQYWTQTHFDCSFEALKKFKNDNIQILQSVMPNFETRLPEFKGKN